MIKPASSKKTISVTSVPSDMLMGPCSYLILSLKPIDIGSAGPGTILFATEVAVYSEQWPTSIEGEVRVVLREAHGPYHISGKALDKWAKDYLPSDLKKLHRPRSWK
jgi:hypothetical protein